MAPGTFDKAAVSLTSERLILSQDVDMPIFHIESLTVVDKTFRGGRIGISAKMVLKRKITSEMMTTFLPSVLLMMITFATTFFKPFFFEAALSVNLTTMLVMTTIFISKMESLPPTSDIKMIDIWLILCQLVPFAQVVLLTAIEYLREEEKEKREVEKQGKGEVEGPGEKEVETHSQNEPMPLEAWEPKITEPVAANMMQKLVTVGRFLRCS